MAEADSRRMIYRKAPPLPGLCAAEARAVTRALGIIERRYGRDTDSSEPLQPHSAKALARLHIGAEDREVFLALWLDSQHKLIAAERVSVGTLAMTTVYPREVVRSAITHNAAAVIFAHNHPSGSTMPSKADVSLTRVLTDALRLIEVAVLDHMIATFNNCISLKERGLM